VDLTFWFVTRFIVPKPLRPPPSSRRAVQRSRPIEPINITNIPLGGTP
jgi:hypothetical protein